MVCGVVKNVDISMDAQEIAALGASLRQIDQKLLKKIDAGHTTRLWYQGGEPYFDIFFDLKDHEIIWFQVTFRGKSLSWEQKQGCIKTGTTNELIVDEVAYYSASKIIEVDSKSDLNFQQLVQAIFKTRAGDAIFDQAIALLGV